MRVKEIMLLRTKKSSRLCEGGTTEAISPFSIFPNVEIAGASLVSLAMTVLVYIIVSKTPLVRRSLNEGGILHHSNTPLLPNGEMPEGQRGLQPSII